MRALKAMLETIPIIAGQVKFDSFTRGMAVLLRLLHKILQ